MRHLPTLLLLLILVLPGAPRLAAKTSAEVIYQEAFSVARLGAPPPSAALTAEFTLAYRGAIPHAAFAVARDSQGLSTWGFVSGRASAAAAAADALHACRARLGQLQAECRVIAQDNTVEGATSVPNVQGSIGPFGFSPLHLRRGPEAARGVLVWGHGYAGPGRDNRTVPVPGIASILNDAGWDVLRFDRHPAQDSLFTSLPRLIAGLVELRGAGYRQIILGGQSRGGWQAVMAASERSDLVDAVVATAPAAHGAVHRPNNHGAALDDFRRLLAGLPAAGGPRVLIALFEADEHDADPERRALLLEALARSRTAPLLALWPQGDGSVGIRGHAGASDWRFTWFFGSCVLTLIQAPEAAAPRGLRRAPCGSG